MFRAASMRPTVKQSAFTHTFPLSYSKEKGGITKHSLVFLPGNDILKIMLIFHWPKQVTWSHYFKYAWEIP